MDCSPPGSIHGILQVKILEWLDTPFSKVIFPTQGLNPHPLRLLHWQVGSLPLVPQYWMAKNKNSQAFEGSLWETKPKTHQYWERKNGGNNAGSWGKLTVTGQDYRIWKSMDTEKWRHSNKRITWISLGKKVNYQMKRAESDCLWGTEWGWQGTATFYYNFFVVVVQFILFLNFT